MQKIITSHIIMSFPKVHSDIQPLTDFLIKHDVEFITKLEKDDVTILLTFRNANDDPKFITDYLKENFIPFNSFTKMTCI